MRINRTSSSFGATTSASSTSAPTTMGMMGYRTPNIDRIAKEGDDLHRLLRPAELHRGPRGVHHRASPRSDGADQGRPAGRADRAAKRGPDHRGAAEAPRLRHRPVRQEPPRRSQRVSCRRSTGSTSSSAISTTSTPRKSRRTPTTRRTRPSRRSSARAAYCIATPPTSTIRPSTRASARSASRTSRTQAR